MEVTNVPKAWLNVAEACEYLRVSQRTIYRRINDRSIPFRKLGGRVLFSIKALDKSMEKGLIPAKPMMPV